MLINRAQHLEGQAKLFFWRKSEVLKPQARDNIEEEFVPRDKQKCLQLGGWAKVPNLVGVWKIVLAPREVLL